MGYPTDFDPEALLDRAFGMFYDDPLEVKIWFSADQARYIQERQWAPDQKISTCKDGSIELWMKTSGWYDVKKWILSFGSDAELLGPEELRDKIRNEAKKIAKAYE
ncbi:MAG: WYL domain-containing protein [Deltaproteobacteria bacterium]|nr:WYL domain-containing protein [Deltaproteobacteria bacterium]